MLVNVHGTVTASVKVDRQGGVGALQGQLSKVAVTEMGNVPALVKSIE